LKKRKAINKTTVCLTGIMALCLLWFPSVGQAQQNAPYRPGLILAAGNLDSSARLPETNKEKAQKPELASDILSELPDEDALAIFATAATKLAQGDQIEGLRLLIKASQLDPKSAWLHLELSRIYYNHKKDDLSLKAAEKAVSLNPKLAKAWVILGRLYAVRQELLKAIEAYRKALKINDKQDDARLFLANLLTRDGQLNDAVNELNILVGGCPPTA
jgi:tetratricopeptide (TPR) repeat protein